MSLYEDRFNNHPLHEQLDSAIKKLESIGAEVSEENSEHVTRLVKVANHTKSSLSNMDPSFMTESVLNQLNKILTNINGDLDNFVSNKDASLLVTANSRADNILIQLQQLTRITEPSEVKELAEYLTNFHKSMDAILSILNSKRQQSEEEFIELNKKIEQLTSTINQQNQTIESQKARLDSAISQFQTQFSQAEDRRRESYEKETSARSEEGTVNYFV